jgi:parvulin-like peptidyl-prolyl isomerase
VPLALRPGSIRPSSLLAALVVGALALAGCSSSGGSADESAAATVNDVEIPTELLVDATAAAVEAPEGSTSLLTSDTSRFLTQLIQIEAARQEVEERGVEITDELRAEAETSLFEALGTDQTTGTVDAALGEQQFNALDEVLRDLSLDAQVTLLALSRSIPDDELGIEEVTDEEIQQYYDEVLESRFTRRCANVMVVDSTLRGTAEQEARAEELVEALSSGTGFDELVAEESPDPENPSGGPLPCATQAEMQEQQLLPELGAALWEVDEGEAFGPVVTANGVFVGIVEEDQVVPLDEAELELRAELSAQSDSLRSEAMSALLATLVVEADVWVAPVQGTWVLLDSSGAVVDDPEEAASAEVQAPTGPEDAPVTSTTFPTDLLGGVGGTPSGP